MTTSRITGALIVCVAAAGIAVGALVLEPSSSSSPAAPAAATTPGAVGAGAVATTTPAAGGYGDNPDAGADAGATDAGTSTGGAAAPAAATLEISGFQFTPISVAPGAQITVNNRDGATHTVTSDNGSFDSGEVAGGGSGSFTAPTQPGTYTFHCQIHPDMAGTLTVTG
jgi:plastocyanin